MGWSRQARRRWSSQLETTSTGSGVGLAASGSHGTHVPGETLAPSPAAGHTPGRKWGKRRAAGELGRPRPHSTEPAEERRPVRAALWHSAAGFPSGPEPSRGFPRPTLRRGHRRGDSGKRSSRRRITKPLSVKAGEAEAQRGSFACSGTVGGVTQAARLVPTRASRAGYGGPEAAAAAGRVQAPGAGSGLGAS